MADGREPGSKHATNLGLRTRILAISLLPILLACMLMAGYFSYRGLREVEESLYSAGMNLARHLAETSSRDFGVDQPLYLKRLFDHERALHGAPTIGLRDAQGRWWLSSGQASLLAVSGTSSTPGWFRNRDLLYFTHPVLAVHDDSGGAAASPPNPRVIGQITVVLPTTRLVDAKSEIITATFTVLSLLLALSGLVAWRLSTRVSRPIEDVLGAVRAINGGDLGARCAESSSGDLRSLEAGVNQMAESLDGHARDLEARIREAIAGLVAEKQASDQASIAKSRFLAAASHDLRQPLHTLMLLVGALRERLGDSDPETARLTENMEISASAMGSLLNALLDLSRLDAGIIVARPECFPVSDLLDAIALQFTPLAQEKGLRLRVHPSDLTVFSDPTLLERVLANLVANAIRYTERGGVLVGVRRVQKDWARIEVWDTGPGIAPEHRERVFEEFFQLDNQERGHGKGLGLGLSIVRRLVRLLGSSIDLKSTLGRGSCFSVRAIRCELPPGWSRHPSDAMTTLNRQPMVAFIDDDIRILEAMLILFEEWGMEIATGMDAQSVIQDFRQIGRQPDVIISDYRLADQRTGIEAISELRAEFGQDTPAILITGESGASTIQALDNSGIPVLYKPLKPAKLRAILGHLLSRATRD